MPQMAPMNWLSLILFMSVSLLIIIPLTHFSLHSTPLAPTKNPPLKTIPWKW
uniref:ATP synthase F0 subunit 8 n=1 Tax=Heterophrynus longicornis TaxID=1046789 RepID=UPI002410EC2C|nr:ATP synthase F0 subunit 8 [Heterophrynus longicornis]WEM34673.1 ATP synthase subunit 8 [Heterophrynus longicornis]